MPFALFYNTFNRIRALFAKSFAVSRHFNERNLEFHWYGIWNLHLCTLVNEIPNTFVVPQFPLWIDENDNENDDFRVEEEGPEDGDEPDEGLRGPDELERSAGQSTAPESAIPQRASQKSNNPNSNPSPNLEDDGEVDDYGFADTSFASTVASYRAKHPKTHIPDFVIIWASGERTTTFRKRYSGWKIVGIRIPVILEVKRLPPRSLKGKELEKRMNDKMNQAQFQLVEQATHLFIRYPSAESVVAIAAVGPYWCSMTIHSTDMNRGMITGWSTQLALHSLDSDRRFDTILKGIKKLGDGGAVLT